MESQQSLILTASSQELSRQWLQKFDTDGDHEISKEEYLAVEDNSGPDAFDGMDLDHDGCDIMPGPLCYSVWARSAAQRVCIRACRRLLSAMEYLHSGAAFGKASTFLESVDNDVRHHASTYSWCAPIPDCSCCCCCYCRAMAEFLLSNGVNCTRSCSWL
jgi:hypothetical protein|eukprot:COSAG01_NODE_2070_length_8500_cov_7.053803_10_plen_160_part_00